MKKFNYHFRFSSGQELEIPLEIKDENTTTTFNAVWETWSSDKKLFQIEQNKRMFLVNLKRIDFMELTVEDK